MVHKKSWDVGETLSCTHTSKKAVNCKALYTIISSLTLLARQGLPSCGNCDTSDQGETNRNFIQLLKLCVEYAPLLKTWLRKL